MFETVLADLFRFSFPLAVGLVSLIFYVKKQKSGLLVISAAFFMSAVEAILFGTTIIEYLMDTANWDHYWYALYVSWVGLAFSITFTILMIVGLSVLYREMT